MLPFKIAVSPHRSKPSRTCSEQANPELCLRQPCAQARSAVLREAAQAARLRGVQEVVATLVRARQPQLPPPLALLPHRRAHVVHAPLERRLRSRSPVSTRKAVWQCALRTLRTGRAWLPAWRERLRFK